MHAELQTSAVAACRMYYVHDVDFNNNNNNNYYYNYYSAHLVASFPGQAG